MGDVKKVSDKVNKCREWATLCELFGAIFFSLGLGITMVVADESFATVWVAVSLRLVLSIISCILNERAKKLEAKNDV